jgi:hypothetical protein
MRLAVFGSETEDGVRFVRHATRVGFDVNLLVPADNSSLIQRLRKPKMIIGAYDIANITQSVQGCDAVVLLINRLADQDRLELILEALQNESISRLVVCDDTKDQLNYDEFNRLSVSLANYTGDWTVIKRVHLDFDTALKEIDQSLVKRSSGRRSLESFIVDQVTDDRYLGTTVMVTD